MRLWAYLIVFGFVVHAAPAFAKCGMCDFEKDGMSQQEKVQKTVGNMTKKLNLTADQVEKLKPIVEEKIQKKTALQEEHRKQVNAIREDFKTKVNAILTPEQIQEFEKSQMEREKKGRVGKAKHKCLDDEKDEN